MLRTFCFLIFISIAPYCFAQIKWQNVDSLYQPLPNSVHVYYTDQPVDTSAFRAFYVIADLKDRSLDFTTDTTLNRRLKPSQFFSKNDAALVVVNGTFFSFETNRNLNVVIKDGKTVSFDTHLRKLRGKDSLLYAKYLTSAIGITKSRNADVAWIYNDSGMKRPIAFESSPALIRDSINQVSEKDFMKGPQHSDPNKQKDISDRWKMETAIGGGPVLVHDGKIRITNDEELKFAGKAINDKHPRTAMGYTKDNKLIILVVEGRNKQAGGATLIQEAEILKDLGCVEALNLDGGGSSCLLINGKETIKPSDASQRPVPAVFLIKKK